MLYGKKVYLTNYSKDILPKVIQVLNNWDVAQFMAPETIWPYNLEDEEEWYESNRKNKESKFSFAIKTIGDDHYIGGCSYQERSAKNGTCVIGIMIGDVKNQNKGYGYEALTLLLNYLYQELNIRKVLLHVFSFNKRAIHVYEKLGFETEGCLSKQVYRNGEYHDTFIMSLFKEKFLKLRKEIHLTGQNL